MPQSQPVFSFGAIPVEPPAQIPSLRETLIADKARLPTVAPTFSDYSAFEGPVRQQGGRGTCTGHGTAKARAMWHNIWFRHHTDLSPLWIYNLAKQHDGMPEIDGVYVGTAMEMIRLYGAALETDYPYNESQVGLPVPPSVRITDELDIDNWRQFWGVDNLRTALGLLGPCPVVIEARMAFCYPDAEGIVRYKAGDPTLGLHCVCVDGHDDSRGLLRGLNSWGTYYGVGGHFWMEYEYFAHSGYDCYTFTPNVSRLVTGDVNGDTFINVIDAQIALAMAAGSGGVGPSLPELQRVADLNADGKVNVQDVVSLLQKAAGL